MLADIAKRPYITVGFLSFLILTALAATSNALSMRRLGLRWKQLHRLVYVAALLAVLHFIWLVKADLLEPMVYLGIFSRCQPWRAKRRLVDPSSREAALLTCRAHSARGEAK